MAIMQGLGPVTSRVAGLRRYWEALREEESLPSRDRVDPRGLIFTLSHVFLIERQAPGLVRFRLAGRALCDLAGQELRSGPVEMLFDPASRPRLAAQLEMVFTGPCVLEAVLSTVPSPRHASLPARMIALPLTGLTGETSLALGCIDIDVPAGHPASRLSLERVLRQPLGPASLPQEAPPPQGKPALRLVHSR
jgi:hypothetical protein